MIGVVFLKPNFEVMTSGQYEVRQKRVLEMHQCRQQIYLVSPPTALSNKKKITFFLVFLDEKIKFSSIETENDKIKVLIKSVDF